MKTPSERDVKRLCALSLNRCAFPGCSTSIVLKDGTLMGKICHIKARNPKGPRYDDAQSDEERNGFDNLILLCGVHHDIVDADPKQFTVELLKEIKEMHERNGNIEITENESQLARKLLDSYVEIEGHDEAQIVANSPNAVQMSVIGNRNVIAGRDMIHTKKIVQKIVTQPGPQHITEEQAYEVKRLIDELALIDVRSGRADSHKTWYTWLYRKFKVTSYKTIPSEKYEAVISWLSQQKAINRKKLRRTDKGEWQNQLFAGIYTRWAKLGYEKDAIYDFAFQRLGLDEPIISLKDLGEQNLKKLYEIVFRLRPEH